MPPTITYNSAPNWTISVLKHGIFVFELHGSKKTKDLGSINDCGTIGTNIWFEIEKEKMYFDFTKFTTTADFSQSKSTGLRSAIKKKLDVPFI